MPEPITVKEAMQAYELACRTHERKAWRLACHKLAAVLTITLESRDSGPAPKAAKAASPAPAAKPEPTLIEFLSKHGVRDDGGELSARDADLWHKARPFRRRLIRPDGVSLERAAELAFDAGYFSLIPASADFAGGNYHPVTEQMLIDAIDRELAGKSRVDDQDERDFHPDYWSALEPFEREAA